MCHFINNNIYFIEPVIEGRADTVHAAVKEFEGSLIGKDPMNIEDHWQVMYRSGFYRGGPEVMSAISGIDQALWNIKGKFYNAPIYDLLGGACRDKLKVYRWIGGDRPSDISKAAKEAWSQGYHAIKMNGTEELHYIDSFKKIQAVCDRVAAIRDALGYKMDIAVDSHGRVHKPMAKVLARELDQFHLMFIEEPVLSQNNEALREIANNASIYKYNDDFLDIIKSPGLGIEINEEVVIEAASHTTTGKILSGVILTAQ